MSFVDTLRKIRGMRTEEVDIVDLADQEAFLRWINQPYFQKFMNDLEHMALTEGLGLTDGPALLKSVGKREAILGIVEGLRKKERMIRSRIEDERDEESD